MHRGEHGDRDGAEVVHFYARPADLDLPARLVGFRRVEVAVGAAERIEITIPADRLVGPVELTVARHASVGSELAEVDLGDAVVAGLVEDE